MGKRLTEPQQRLLAEIRESSTGGLYVVRRMRYYRTALALERRRLVTRTWVDGMHDWFEPVPEQGHARPLLAGSSLLVSNAHGR